ncbi:aminotransferase class III-fold pyridoxal phosphate-dependent enzyme [Marinobacterium sp. xm-d-564]|uniref:aminotransferase class III-fold pyridoxal phosphate-dependent enzyme n=1 Tax=Marinobacterium sp. xm-d-564 TaxID=2497742 RepID=UPI00156A0F8A|nr:aminotransferase class III-fold pyridoxal phosphate-dependent enzyme [Marinobacterium sp. xm-d-564]
MKVVAIVQARMGSSRLPGKVMKSVGGLPLIEVLLNRLSKSKLIDEIVVATSTDAANRPLATHVKDLGYHCFQGDEKDVLNRYVSAAEVSKADVIVRITGDCPLVDAELVDTVIEHFNSSKADYVSNCFPPTYPDGLDIEVFKYTALKESELLALDRFDREHVTPFLRNSGRYLVKGLTGAEDLSAWRWTVDEVADLQVIRQVFEYFAPRIDFSWKEVAELQRIEPHRFETNQQIIRNEGAMMGEGQKLWKRAKNVIPGGNMLLSKRTEMFLPDQWPSYFSKAKGCTVWDLDGNAYTDMSIMGIGTNTLGYGHPEVDDAVRAVVDNGNMSTLNAPEEVYLAEKLIELHPWADMVRFARSGGEANAIAIRIARAATGKDKVAVCGYHGWHDWYLSANLGDDENLAGHLLPGLEPNGVPNNLKGTVYPFSYNDIEGLTGLINRHDIGVIKMEVVRNMGPEDGFLHKVRQLATDRGIVLIFDECTSGFRETFGGIHKKYGVEPDMAMFGKALGNGYAVTATIGRREIMEAAQTSFISSTFWTERIGSVAGLKTLEVMQREKSWEYITKTGLEIKSQWQALADKYELEIKHWGIPALTGFSFESSNSLKYKTLITQEMLNRGYLASNSIYLCTEHKKDIIEEYLFNLEKVFEIIAKCENGLDVDGLLKGPVCHGGFKRLN